MKVASGLVSLLTNPDATFILHGQSVANEGGVGIGEQALLQEFDASFFHVLSRTLVADIGCKIELSQRSPMDHKTSGAMLFTSRVWLGSSIKSKCCIKAVSRIL